MTRWCRTTYNNWAALCTLATTSATCAILAGGRWLGLRLGSGTSLKTTLGTLGGDSERDLERDRVAFIVAASGEQRSTGGGERDLDLDRERGGGGCESPAEAKKVTAGTGEGSGVGGGCSSEGLPKRSL